MSIRRSGRGSKKRSSRPTKTRGRKTSYVQSSNFLVGEHGNYAEIRDKNGSHVHIHKEIPEMFVMNDDMNQDWDILVDGKPATYHEFSNHPEMYNYLINMKHDDEDDWQEAVNTVWRGYLDG